jgi:hypothetical protein
VLIKKCSEKSAQRITTGYTKFVTTEVAVSDIEDDEIFS